MAAEDLDLSFLPTGLVDIARIIGLDLSLKLVRHLGGLELPIPKRGTDSRVYDAIAEVVGTEAASKLVARYGDTRLNIPRCLRAGLEARNALIRAAYDRGEPVDGLALAHGLTSRQIRTILNSAPAAPTVQVELF